MRYLFRFILSFIFIQVSAQTFYFPYNHDSNNDGHIGISDLMSLLSEYGQVSGLMTNVEIPDYDFQDFEQMVYDIYNGDVVVDSIYVHYRLEAEHTWFPIGSIESQTDTIIYEREVMIPGNPNISSALTGFTIMKYNIDGGNFGFWFSRSGETSNVYRIVLEDQTATNGYLMSIGFTPHRFMTDDSWSIQDGLPESVWSMDGSGWHHEPMVYSSSDVPFTIFECYPYWHLANE